VARARESTKLDFLAYCSVNKLSFAERIWDLSNNSGSTITIEEGDIIEGKVDPCLESLEMRWQKERCLILVGDSGLGKTTIAKKIIPKPCLFISHIDDLKHFKSDYHKSILFDDVCFNHYPVQSQIHLVDFDNPRSIHIRYGVAKIPAKTTKIFTCNEDPINTLHPAIARRVQVVRVSKPYQ